MKYLFMLSITCLLTGCLKTTDDILDYRGIEAVVINPKSNFPSKAVFAAAATDSAFGITQLNLIAKYSFRLPASRDIKITFTRDDALAVKYNASFAKNYLPLPADCYEMPTAQVTIRAGSQEGVLPVKLIPAKIGGNSNYIIAFTISASDEGSIPDNFKSIVYTLKGK